MAIVWPTSRAFRRVPAMLSSTSSGCAAIARMSIIPSPVLFAAIYYFASYLLCRASPVRQRTIDDSEAEMVPLAHADGKCSTDELRIAGNPHWCYESPDSGL